MSSSEEIGFEDPAAGGDTTTVPPIIRTSPRDEHKALLKWAQGKSLHIDPHLGRAESGDKRQARMAAQRLRDIVDRYDQRVEEGEQPEYLDWMLEDARSNAEILRRLKGKV